MKILLASQSPRRKELLSQLGFEFDVVKIECEEIIPQGTKVEEAAGYLSLLKANSFGALKDDEVLLTADTIVAIDEEILGKPTDVDNARDMLKKLSNKTHQVLTAITLKSNTKSITRTDVANVTFSDITEEEINYYIQQYQPFDKAGSYGVQEWLGMAKIEKIEGSYYTIMGLPTHLIYKILKEF